MQHSKAYAEARNQIAGASPFNVIGSSLQVLIHQNQLGISLFRRPVYLRVHALSTLHRNQILLPGPFRIADPLPFHVSYLKAPFG